MKQSNSGDYFYLILLAVVILMALGSMLHFFSVCDAYDNELRRAGYVLNSRTKCEVGEWLLKKSKDKSEKRYECCGSGASTVER